MATLSNARAVRRAGVFGVIAALVAVVLAVAELQRSQVSALTASAWVDHTHRVIEDLGELETAVVRAQSARRGYLLAARDADLRAYRAAHAAAFVKLAEARASTADDAGQQRRIVRLDTLLRAKFAMLATGVGTSGAGLAETDSGRGLVDEIHVTLGAARAVEEALLADRATLATAAARRARRAAGAAVLVAALVALVSLWAVSREAKALGEAWRSARRAERRARESEARYRQLFEQNGAVQLVIDYDRDAIVDANPAAEAFYGRTRDELRATAMTALNGMSREALRAAAEPLARGQHVRVMRRHLVADGSWHDVEVFTGPVTIDGRVVLHSIVHDVADRVRAERAMRESEERYRLLFACNPRPSWVYDTQTLRFLAVNPAAVAHYGWSEAEFLAMTLADIRPHADREAVRDWARLARARGGAASSQRVHETRDGRRLDVQLASHPLEFDGRAARLVIVEDVTERRRLERQLEELVVRDPLTGLLNRRGFDQLAAHELAMARRTHRTDALLYLDLDGFKRINDTHGHAEGDAALREVADVLRATTRENDVVARLGGDELVVYAAGLSHTGEATALADRLRAALDAANGRAAAGGRPYAVAFSVGIAEVQVGDTLDALLARADAALYAEKQGRRTAA